MIKKKNTHTDINNKQLVHVYYINEYCANCKYVSGFHVPLPVDGRVKNKNNVYEINKK